MERRPTESPILLGRVSGLFGVRGWVKIFSYTNPREAILDYRQWDLTQHGKTTSYRLSNGQRQGKGVIVQFEGISDRTVAQKLMGAEVSVGRTQLQPTSEDEYYWADLIGCEVLDLQQQSLGKVVELMETGANDVMIVRQGQEERLIPFVDPWVVEVDLPGETIVVSWEADY